jgi:hypothetical protein
VATQPTFRFGNPVVVRSESLQTGVVSAPIAPRPFDMHPDGSIIGTVESQGTSSAALAAPRIEVVLNWFEELKARVPSR